MYKFFPEPYKDEILYSIIGRYHYYIGNSNFRNTLEEIFNSKNVVSSIEFTSNLENLCDKFGENSMYNSKYFISNHTLLPYYSVFIPKMRRVKIENEIKYKDGKGLYSKLGFLAGSICAKSGIKYCPMCFKEDVMKYGEAYFHRIHQLQGVLVCPDHGCLIVDYCINPDEESRLAFIIRFK
jgi:hypothetical protein